MGQAESVTAEPPFQETAHGFHQILKEYEVQTPSRWLINTCSFSLGPLPASLLVNGSQSEVLGPAASASTGSF